MTERGTAWRSLIETLVLTGGFLFLEKERSYLSLLLVLIAVIWIYVSQPGERRYFRSVFFITSALVAIFIKFFAPENIPLPLITLSFFALGLVFFAVLGLSNTIFTKKKQVYGLLNTAMGMLLITIGLIAAKNSFFLLALLPFPFTAGLIKEYLIFIDPDRIKTIDGIKPKNTNLTTMGLVGALVITELSIFLTILPISFPAAIWLSSLVFVVIRTILSNNIKGALDLKTCLTEAIIVVSGIILAFISGGWGK